MPTKLPRLYQVRDRQSMFMCSGIMLDRTDGTAIRAFTEMLGNNKTVFSKHPHDYDLMCIGEQDDDGTIYPMVPPVLVIDGMTVLENMNRAEMAARNQVAMQAKLDRIGEMDLIPAEASDARS